MKKNLSLLHTIATLLAATVLSVLFFDRPSLAFISNHFQTWRPAFSNILQGLEISSGFTISKYLVAGILLMLGIFVWINDKNRLRANIFLFVGLTHLSSRLCTGILKNVFHRSRPHDYLADNSIGDFFVQNGSSFPSGHVAHFFSLFLPFIILFPKYKWSLLVIPVFVALQRIISMDHYTGDTLAAILIATVFTYVFYIIIKPYKQ
jgi:membrane-associated phospholipid phosphatase